VGCPLTFRISTFATNWHGFALPKGRGNATNFCDSLMSDLGPRRLSSGPAEVTEVGFERGRLLSLWDFQTGGAVRTNPMSFEIDGEQRIVTSAGGVVFVFGLP
jgi:hypothetical protein